METSNEPTKKKYKDIYSRIVEKRKELMAEKDERIKLEEERIKQEEEERIKQEEEKIKQEEEEKIKLEEEEKIKLEEETKRKEQRKKRNLKTKEECSVCCELFNKSTRVPIVCGFCPSTNFKSCMSCVKRYLFETTQNAHCMNCRHEWSRVFLYSWLPKVWLNNEYKKRRQDLIEELERSMMPSTQPYVEIELDKRKIKNILIKIGEIKQRLYYTDSYTDMHLELEIDRVKYEHRYNVLSHEIRLKEQELNKKSSDTYRAKFVRQCPMDECKGFLSTAWKCGLCNTKVCSKCHEPKTQDDAEEGEEGEEREGEHHETLHHAEETKTNTSNSKHICKPENLETAKLLNRDSKTCPNCASLIFKISGCDQMFCTQCHTAFSWTTGKIETRIIHNPHYFEYLRDISNGNEIPRNPLDNPCADIMPDGEAFNRDMIEYIYRKTSHIPAMEYFGVKRQVFVIINRVIRLCNHIVTYHFVFDNLINQNLDLRIQYMMNTINIEKFKTQLQQREKQRDKSREFDLIFRTYVIAARDILFNFVNLDSVDEQVLKQHHMITELQHLHAYINECFKKLIPIYNNTVWQIKETDLRLDLNRIK